GDLLAEGALDDGRIEDAASGDDLAERRGRPPLLGQELVELVARDLAGAHQDLAQRVGPPRAAHQPDAVVEEVDDLPLPLEHDGQVALAAGHGEGLEEIRDAQDFNVAFDLSHAFSARVGPSWQP